MTEPATHDWYLLEWMDHFEKRQADLVKDRGWLKGRVSKFLNGEHQYRRDILNELADWLGIEPFELLMRPAEAVALRQLRETAALIVAGATVSEPTGRTGNGG